MVAFDHVSLSGIRTLKLSVHIGKSLTSVRVQKKRRGWLAVSKLWYGTGIRAWDSGFYGPEELLSWYLMNADGRAIGRLLTATLLCS